MLTGGRKAILLLQAFANLELSPENPASLVPFIEQWGPLVTQFVGGGAFNEEVMPTYFLAQREFQADWTRLGCQAAREDWPAWDLDRIEERERVRLKRREHFLGTKGATTAETLREQRRAAWAGMFDPPVTLPGFVFDFESPFEVFGYIPRVKRGRDSRGDQFFGLRIGIRTLLGFLTFSLYATDARYLRKCWNPHCGSYFVAEDRKNHFCCDACSDWGRSETKRQWHRKHEKEWREKRQAKRKN